jgi:hypothetical protein
VSHVQAGFVVREVGRMVSCLLVVQMVDNVVREVGRIVTDFDVEQEVLVEIGATLTQMLCWQTVSYGYRPLQSALQVQPTRFSMIVREVGNTLAEDVVQGAVVVVVIVLLLVGSTFTQMAFSQTVS